MSLPACSFLHILNFLVDASISRLHYVCRKPLLFSLSPCFLHTAPPSAPVSLSWEYESADGGVSLRWRPPVDMGGRSEVWYGVVCRICPSATFTNPTACSWCGEGVTFSPSQTNLKQTKVTLNNLLTRVTYLIQVLWKTVCWRHKTLSVWVGFTVITALHAILSYWWMFGLNLWCELEEHFTGPLRCIIS